MLMQDFAASLSFRDLPEDVLKVLRRSLLDSIGVAAVGSQTDMARIGTKTARAMFGATSASAARCLFDGQLASLAGAAMAGAITIDSIDAHDGTSPCKGHAGSAIFPALLALAVLPPQVGFLLYFVFLHSPLHMRGVAATLPSWSGPRFWIYGGLMCFACLALAVLLAPGLISGQSLAMSAEAFRLLSVVAAPHLLLTLFVDRWVRT